MAQIVTKVGTFDVIEKNNGTIVCKNGKELTNLPDVKPWDKDAIIDAIETDAVRLNKLSLETTNSNIPPENVVDVLTHIYEMLNSNIKDKQTKGFVTSRLKQIINKLAA